MLTRSVLAIAALFCFVGLAQAAPHGTVCVPFAQTGTVGTSSDFVNVCFQSDQVARVKTIYSGKSGNQIEVVLWDGTRFYKSGMTAVSFSGCVSRAAGGNKIMCDDVQTAGPIRDLTRGDISTFERPKTKTRRQSPYRDELNRCAVSVSWDC